MILVTYSGRNVEPSRGAHGSSVSVSFETAMGLPEALLGKLEATTDIFGFDRLEMIPGALIYQRKCCLYCFY